MNNIQGNKLLNKYGSKERLFELMRGVNKLSINEANGLDSGVDIYDKTKYIETDDVTDQYIETLDNQKQIDGEKLIGGMGDNQTEQSFDIEQIKRGLRVEMEHTNDPMIALEIVYDHLSENDKYYDELEKMEANFRNDDQKSSDEIISQLMGWKPKVVGDYAKTGGDNFIGDGSNIVNNGI